MKLLGVFALVALCGGTTNPPPSPDCELSGVISPSEFRTVWTKVENCTKSGMTPAMSKELRDTRDLEAIVTIFDEFCQRSNETVRECLREQTSKYESCPNVKLLKFFNVYRHQLETALDVVCAGGSGRRLAYLWYGMNEILDLSQNPELVGEVEMCAQELLMAVGTVTRNKVDVPSAVFILHQKVSTFKECFFRIKFDARFREVSELIFDEIIRADRCLHPQDETLVLCSDVDSTLLISPTLCSAKAVGGLTVYDALEDDALKCYGKQVAIFVRNYDTSADVDGLREDFKTFCSQTVFPRVCLDKTTAFSEMCLNETQRAEFVVLRESTKRAVESACRDNGKRLADVTIEIQRLKKDSVEHAHPVTECLDVVMATRKQLPSLSLNLRFYRELEAFKGCFVEKLRADITSVNSATTVIDEMRGKVSCLNPEDGSTVLCETLSTP